MERGFIDPQLKLHLDYLESELARHEWFGGDVFSVAAIQLSFPLEAFAARGGLDAATLAWAPSWEGLVHARLTGAPSTGVANIVLAERSVAGAKVVNASITAMLSACDV